jgi:hypothetical protein
MPSSSAASVCPVRPRRRRTSRQRVAPACEAGKSAAARATGRSPPRPDGPGRDAGGALAGGRDRRADAVERALAAGRGDRRRHEVADLPGERAGQPLGERRATSASARARRSWPASSTRDDDDAVLGAEAQPVVARALADALPARVAAVEQVGEEVRAQPLLGRASDALLDDLEREHGRGVLDGADVEVARGRVALGDDDVAEELGADADAPDERIGRARVQARLGRRVLGRADRMSGRVGDEHRAADEPGERLRDGVEVGAGDDGRRQAPVDVVGALEHPPLRLKLVVGLAQLGDRLVLGVDEHRHAQRQRRLPGERLEGPRCGSVSSRGCAE